MINPLNALRFVICVIVIIIIRNTVLLVDDDVLCEYILNGTQRKYNKVE